MSSGFVSASGDDANSAETDAWAAARAAVNQLSEAKPSDPQEERSLYDILQANKAKKQEEFEEKLKFKNQFKPLDEDDVEYLDSVVADERRAEALRQRELQSQLDEFRRLQYEADRPGTVAEDASTATEEGTVGAEFGGWKKRKRKESAHPTAAAATKTGLGLKVRRTSSGAEKPAETSSKVDEDERKGSIDKTGSAPPKESVKPLAKKHIQPERMAQPQAAATGLGLVEYGSDEDDD